MTNKRCIKTGKRAIIEASMYLDKGYYAEQYNEYIVHIVCSYADLEHYTKILLRDETKLERLLDGSEEN